MRSLLLTLSLAIVLPVASAAAAPLSSSQIVTALNAQRSAQGLPSVREDAQLSAGCAAHNEYLVRNGAGYYQEHGSDHSEDASRPGYTKAGDHAAGYSLLAGAPEAGWQGGNPWTGAPIHLFQLLNPGLAVVGADERPLDLGDGRTAMLECLDTNSGPRRVARKLRAYVVPAPGGTLPATMVNLDAFPMLGVAPGASGPPYLFVYFVGGGVKSVRVSSLSATLNGNSQPLIAEYAGKARGPAASGRSALGSREPALAFAPRPAEYPASDCSLFKVKIGWRATFARSRKGKPTVFVPRPFKLGDQTTCGD